MGVLSLNDRAKRLAEQLTNRAAEVGVSLQTVSGAQVIDAGVDATGSLEAGCLVARICMADLGTVQITAMALAGAMLPAVTVNVRFPVAACMASQYAGWQISEGKYFAMGSGPMRAAYGKEDLFNDIGFREKPRCAVGVLESAKLPDGVIVDKIVQSCGVEAANVMLIVARTASLAGGVQVVARSVETTLHKLHALDFDLNRVVAGFGAAPLPPVAKDDLAAIGRTNDAMLYGAQTTLYVTGDDESLAQVGEQLPSSASKDYGRPFTEIFKQYDHDFYRIDPMLFSPAAVSLQNMDTGRTHVVGKVNHEVLLQSFFN